MPKGKVKLGDLCRDTVTGFEGVAISRHSYLNGCSRVTLQPVVDKKGKLPEYSTFDEPQLETIEVEKAAKGSTKTGGPDKYPDTGRSEG